MVERLIARLALGEVVMTEMWHPASVQLALSEAGLDNEYTLLAPVDANGTKIVCGAIVRRDLLVGEPEWIVEFPEKFLLQSSGDDPQTPIPADSHY